MKQQTKNRWLSGLLLCGITLSVANAEITNVNGDSSSQTLSHQQLNAAKQSISQAKDGLEARQIVPKDLLKQPFFNGYMEGQDNLAKAFKDGNPSVAQTKLALTLAPVERTFDLSTGDVSEHPILKEPETYRYAFYQNRTNNDGLGHYVLIPTNPLKSHKPYDLNKFEEEFHQKQPKGTLQDAINFLLDKEITDGNASFSGQSKSNDPSKLLDSKLAKNSFVDESGQVLIVPLDQLVDHLLGDKDLNYADALANTDVNTINTSATFSPYRYANLTAMEQAIQNEEQRINDEKEKDEGNQAPSKDKVDDKVDEQADKNHSSNKEDKNTQSSNNQVDKNKNNEDKKNPQGIQDEYHLKIIKDKISMPRHGIEQRVIEPFVYVPKESSKYNSSIDNRIGVDSFYIHPEGVHVAYQYAVDLSKYDKQIKAGEDTIRIFEHDVVDPKTHGGDLGQWFEQGLKDNKKYWDEEAEKSYQTAKHAMAVDGYAANEVAWNLGIFGGSANELKPSIGQPTEIVPDNDTVYGNQGGNSSANTNAQENTNGNGQKESITIDNGTDDDNARKTSGGVIDVTGKNKNSHRNAPQSGSQSLPNGASSVSDKQQARRDAQGESLPQTGTKTHFLGLGIILTIVGGLWSLIPKWVKKGDRA